jgi:hypothetical protein
MLMRSRPRVIDVDGATERRTASLNSVGLLGLFATLLFLVTPDKRLYLALAPALVVLLGYRIWLVERFSPQVAQAYARAAVSRTGEALLAVLRTDPYLADAWSRAGVNLYRLAALPPDRLAEAMRALRRDRYPIPRLAEPLHTLNRLLAVVLGVGQGLAASWAVAGAPLPPLPWPVWLGLVLLVGSQLGVWWHNRWQLARVAALVAAAPRAELTELLAPPWWRRLQATVVELNRLADHAAGTARRLPLPELRVVELLVAGGIGAGLLLGPLAR